MPAVMTIKQIAYQAFMDSRTDRELFSTLVRADVRELGYDKAIISLVNRLALILFDHWTKNGVKAEGFPQEFMDIYKKASD
jgi:hypothetical protein